MRPEEQQQRDKNQQIDEEIEHGDGNEADRVFEVYEKFIYNPHFVFKPLPPEEFEDLVV
jgi:hypothetical protein